MLPVCLVISVWKPIVNIYGDKAPYFMVEYSHMFSYWWRICFLTDDNHLKFVNGEISTRGKPRVLYSRTKIPPYFFRCCLCNLMLLIFKPQKSVDLNVSCLLCRLLKLHYSLAYKGWGRNLWRLNPVWVLKQEESFDFVIESFHRKWYWIWMI